ncbi:hypothetical protein [Nocardia sp. XZ_19_385]|uniref:hypothetical protein n=1 Tax=Nocardia sp. XZ_19_385 TaxID=2769488 RepID=UPI00188EF787|nr:hypothetical protein [Nocardia sp. XZ_19_385]
MSGHVSPAELLDAVYYASAVITFGADPDRPGRVITHTFQTEDAPSSVPVPVAVAVAALRELADDLESGGAS